MDVCVKLLTGDVWAAEDDTTGFLSVGVDIFDRLLLKNWPMFLTMVQIITKKRKYDNED